MATTVAKGVVREVLYFSAWWRVDQAVVVAVATNFDMTLRLFKAMALDLAVAKSLSATSLADFRKVETEQNVLKRFFRSSAFKSKMATA